MCKNGCDWWAHKAITSWSKEVESNITRIFSLLPFQRYPIYWDWLSDSCTTSVSKNTVFKWRLTQNGIIIIIIIRGGPIWDKDFVSGSLAWKARQHLGHIDSLRTSHHHLMTMDLIDQFTLVAEVSPISFPPHQWRSEIETPARSLFDQYSPGSPGRFVALKGLLYEGCWERENPDLPWTSSLPRGFFTKAVGRAKSQTP